MVVSLKKRIVQMLADCFGRFNLWICLETSNVCELRNMLKENGVCFPGVEHGRTLHFHEAKEPKKKWWS